jgi:hypothetical protein
LNKSEIEAIRIQLEVTIKLLSSYAVALDYVIGKEKEIEKREGVVGQLNNSITKREEDLIKERQLLETHKNNFDEEKKVFKRVEDDFKIQQDRFNGRKQEITTREKAVEDKIKTFDLLKNREASVIEREQQAQKQKENLEQRENVLKKEIELARERKMSFDIIEADLRRKQAKVQKFLELENA